MFRDDDDRDAPSLRDYFPWMTPILEIPTVFRILGTGLTMVGRFQPHAETKTYVSVHCVTLLFVPIFALGVYRVQDAPRGGWYFVGQESLGVLSWLGNSLAVVLLLGLIGGGVWLVRGGGAELADGRKLALADQLLAEGRRGEAAELFGQILEGKTTHVTGARERLGEMIQKPSGDESDVVVFRVAAAQDRKGDPIVPDLFKRGHQAADVLGAKDPLAGLRLLEMVAPLALDQTEALQLERRLIEPLARKAPGDVELASRLASLMASSGEANAVLRPILLPHEDKLGTLDGAAVLGGIYSDEGNYTRAVKLLKPFVDGRIQAFLNANRQNDEAQKAVVNRVGSAIDSGNMPGFDVAKFRAAKDEQKREMFRDFVIPLIQEDATVRIAGHTLNRERLVLPAVLNLGLAELHLAQTAANPEERRTGLERAEQTLLRVREQANSNPMFRARLAQVYYWLGKPAEGRALLDDMMKDQKHSIEIVNSVAQLLRGVGAVTEARKLVEDAYNKETSKEGKQELAKGRSLLALDLDDRIVWLKKTGLDDVYMKASLASALGQKAGQLGKDDEAAKHYKEGIALYGGLADSSSILNNAALCYFGLYDATHDIATFREGLRRLEKAISLENTSAILMMNYADALLVAASADAIGNDLDFKVLRRRPGLDLLPHLYLDAAGKDRILARLRASPYLATARTTLERALVLAPSNPTPYSQLANLLEFLEDGPALTTLVSKLDTQPLDTGDNERLAREFYTGKKDAQRIEEARASIARAEKAMMEAMMVKGPTFAAAACRVSNQMLTLAYFTPIEADRAVKLAEQGHAEAPSDATRAAVSGAKLYRAAVALGKDPSFAQSWREGQRSLGAQLVAWALVGGGEPRKKALALEDVKAAIALKVEQVKVLPVGRGPSAWALLQGNDEEGARLAQRLKDDPTEGAKLRIEGATSPLSSTTAAEQAWMLRIQGKMAEAKQLLDERAKRGVPLPVWGR